MADKYLNLQGLTEVAEKVNKKLRIVTTMPASPELNDIVVYNGASTASYKQGCTYLYTTVETYYEWSDLSDTYYTKAETPEVGDVVYSDTSGTDSGYTIEAFDDVNNQVTINSLTYDRNSTGDTPINDWVSKGGTSVILNGKDKTGEEASFYAAPQSGNEGQVLISKGENEDPEWASYTGYCPTVIDDYLYFNYGVIPSVENTSIIFDTD
jgi:hypothetical protein